MKMVSLGAYHDTGFPYNLKILILSFFQIIDRVDGDCIFQLLKKTLKNGNIILKMDKIFDKSNVEVQKVCNEII